MLPTATLTSSSSTTHTSTTKDVSTANHSAIQEQETTSKVSSDDLVSLHAIPDLYDPLVPNSYYELVYKRKMDEIAHEEVMSAQKGEDKAEERESTSTAALSAPNGIIPASMFGERILYKQGWQGGGFGLGKEGQGMATPLIGSEASTVLSDGTSKTLGTISHAPLRTLSSRVVLLRNMVLRGQADANLASETASECADFGRILQCIVREETDRNQCEDCEAVRIFIQFENTKAAEQAKNALNARYFAGRCVQASFYPEAAFSENRYWLPVNP